MIGPIDFNLSLVNEPFFTLSGRISGLSDADQIVEITAWSENGSHTVSRRGNGLFSLEGLVNGHYAVEVHARGYSAKRIQTLTIDNGIITNLLWTSAWHHAGSIPITANTTGLDVQLDAGYNVAGKVISQNGNPVAGVWVNALDKTSQIDAGNRTDANGQYQIQGLPPGSYTLSVWSKNGKASREITDLTDSITDQTLTIEQQSGAVSGNIQSFSGNARQGVLMVIYDTSFNQVAASTTNHLGHFILDALPPGRYTLHAFGADDLSKERLFAEKTAITVTETITHIGILKLSSEL